MLTFYFCVISLLHGTYGHTQLKVSVQLLLRACNNSAENVKKVGEWDWAQVSRSDAMTVRQNWVVLRHSKTPPKQNSPLLESRGCKLFRQIKFKNQHNNENCQLKRKTSEDFRLLWKENWKLKTEKRKASEQRRPKSTFRFFVPTIKTSQEKCSPALWLRVSGKILLATF